MIVKLTACMAAFGFIVACNGGQTPDSQKAETQSEQMTLKEATVDYGADTFKAKGYIAYDAANENKRPAVLVVPEWWGLNDYARSRAKQLAQLGYVAMAVDMYGDGKTTEDPKQAMAFTMPYYKDPTLTRARLDLALQKLRTLPEVDTANIAAIGYCYGGFVVLNAAKLGADLKGVASFHGGLAGVPPHKDLLKAKLLVLNGGADSLVSQADRRQFRKSLDSVGADYIYKDYPGALHAFTNPASTEAGKKLNMPIAYNAAADTASWNELKTFLGRIFTKK